ncbi:TPA: hypothetical protein ACH3X3_001778 [Trebouxia sp. C0006]
MSNTNHLGLPDSLAISRPRLRAESAVQQDQEVQQLPQPVWKFWHHALAKYQELSSSSNMTTAYGACGRVKQGACV